MLFDCVGAVGDEFFRRLQLFTVSSKRIESVYVQAMYKKEYFIYIIFPTSAEKKRYVPYIVSLDFVMDLE